MEGDDRSEETLEQILKGMGFNSERWGAMEGSDIGK